MRPHLLAVSALLWMSGPTVSANAAPPLAVAGSAAFEISLPRPNGADYHIARARSQLAGNRDLSVTFWITNNTGKLIDLDGESIWCGAEVPPGMGDDGEDFQSAYFKISGARLLPHQTITLALVFRNQSGNVRGFTQGMTGRIVECGFTPNWSGQRRYYRDNRTITPR